MKHTTHVKHATPDHPIHELISARWSPYAYNGKSVEPAKLLSCLEAARWAASSYNEQPWRFIIATRDNRAEWDRLLSCLLEANQAWARHAGVLILTVASTTFQRNGKPNRVCEHDIALAAANLTFQATALGLHVHQMAGINADAIRQTYAIPAGFNPVTAIAIGYAASTATEAPDAELAQRDAAARSRKPLSEFVFASSWGTSAPVVK